MKNLFSVILGMHASTCSLTLWYFLIRTAGLSRCCRGSYRFQSRAAVAEAPVAAARAASMRLLWAEPCPAPLWKRRESCTRPTDAADNARKRNIL